MPERITPTLPNGEIDPEAIAAARTAHEHTQTEMAHQLGYGRRTIQYWEYGEKIPRIDSHSHRALLAYIRRANRILKDQENQA